MSNPRSAYLGGMALLLVAAALPVRADEKAEALLKQTREATKKIQTLRADVQTEMSSPGGPVTSKGTLVLKRPNLVRLEVQGKLAQTAVSDGKSFFLYMPGRNQYRKGEPGSDGRTIPIPCGEPATGFFHPETIGLASGGGSTTYIGKETLEGVAYDVVEVVAKIPANVPGPEKLTSRYFIDPNDHLIHRTTVTFEDQGNTITNVCRFRNMETDVAVEDSLFRWSPPAGATLLVLPRLENTK